MNKCVPVITPEAFMNLTIRDLMADPNLEFQKKGDTLEISTPDGIILIKARNSRTASTTSAKNQSDAAATSAPKTRKARGSRNQYRSLQELAPQVEKLRREGLSQAKVAAKLNTTQANISRIEKILRSEAAAKAAAPADASSSLTLEPAKDSLKIEPASPATAE